MAEFNIGSVTKNIIIKFTRSSNKPGGIPTQYRLVLRQREIEQLYYDKLNKPAWVVVINTDKLPRIDKLLEDCLIVLVSKLADLVETEDGFEIDLCELST